MRTPTWLSFVLAGSMALTACAAEEPEPADDGGSASAETDSGSAGDDAGAQASEADACTLDEPVPVGVVFSQTGGAAVYGEAQTNGVLLAVDELHERDGGITYELVIEDDASVPEQGIPAFEKLINRDGVSIIIGPTLSSTAMTTNPVANDSQVPVLGVSNTAAGITEIGEYVFRNSLTEGQVIPQTVEAATERFDLSRVAVLYGDDDAFTESGYEVFQAAIDEQGLEVTTTQTFAKGDTDFSAQLTVIRQSEPEALIVSALAEEAALVLDQARALGLEVPVIGGNGFNSPAILDNAGEAAEGALVGAAWNSAADTPDNRDFIAAFEEAYNSRPDQFAAQAYAGMKIVAAAVEQVCSTDPTEIRDGLADLPTFATVLGEFAFTEGRDADHPAVVQIVEDGQFAILE